MEFENTDRISSNNCQLISEVMDSAQLNRIEAVHRGFLYQHLYAVACLLNLGLCEEGEIRVERDEDVEVITAEEINCVQVKTRSRQLIASDIKSALERFEQLRKHYAEANPDKALRFVIASNNSPGKLLARQYASEKWPQDVSIISPGEPTLDCEILPPTWQSLNHAVRWCVEAAEKIPFATLHPETLVWKLAARVQFAASGQDPDREDHVFDRGDLPQLFEQLVEQLQKFPAVPEDFRPQQGEPALFSEAPVRLIVGLSGAGKTVWASWQAQHCSAPTVYFDVSDLPGKALAGSLARELAARFLGSGTIGAAQLPLASGLELLRALANRIELLEPPLVVLDNVHRVEVEEIRRIVETCHNVRFILLGQPWLGKTQLEAHLGIRSEELHGWDEDTIASVFASAGATISPQAASQWRSITAGMPLFVKNAALLSVSLANGDATAFAMQVEQGKHPEELAQEALLRLTIETLSDDESAITAALSLSTAPLSIEEIGIYLGALPTPVRRQSIILRSLQQKGIIQIFANGVRKIHDAMRVLVGELVLEFSADEKLVLQVQLRDILFESVLEAKDLVRLGAWMRLLPPTGQVETLVDMASYEYFHEVGEPHDLKQILVSVANAEDTEPSLRFWTLDALAFWQFQESEPKHLPDDYLERMAELVASNELSSYENSALIMKQMLNAGLKQDRRGADYAFERARVLCETDQNLSRILRYNYANALLHCGALREALSIAESLYVEYYDVLGFHPSDIIGANNQRILSLLPGEIGDHQDNLKHLADCLNLAAMCLRKNGQHPRLTAIHAAKFYTASGSYRSAMKTAQDVSDDFIAIGDALGARQTMEEHVLPILKYFQFKSNTIDIRGQYAVILAYCGEYNRARAEMAALAPYVGTLPPEHQTGFARQRQLVEQIASGLVQMTQPTLALERVPNIRRQRTAGKIGRNAPCPCGSGKKYKKCCLTL